MQLIPSLIYASLFSMAFFPVLFKMQTFPFYLSKGRYPISIVKSPVFYKINQMISLTWAVLFALSFITIYLPFSPYSANNTLIANAVVLGMQIFIGIPLSLWIPVYYAKQKKYKIRFETLKDAFEAMPFGLNRAFAKEIDVVVAFEISGEETQQSYLLIKEQKCTYKKERHPNPTVTIKADSELWLDVVNGDVDNVQSYLNKEYEMIGDASVMLIFNDLFDMSAKAEVIKDRERDYDYKQLENKEIKNIVVFDGGKRNRGLSKTTFMVDKFVEGAKSAGAKVEEFKLSKLQIDQCDGCYMCWTKTPGECVHKDSMSELREKYRSADLVVFASPLYIFNVTGTMKTFMDRLLPVLQPYTIPH